MSSVGRRTEHAGQTTITLTGLHAHFGKGPAGADAHLQPASSLGDRSCEQFNVTSVWQLCCNHLKLTLAAIGPPTGNLLSDHAHGVELTLRF